MEASIIYPHQLFKQNNNLHGTIYLVEDELFFTQYNFHQAQTLLII